MSALKLLEDVAEYAGWDTEAMLDAACQYIDNQQSEEAFDDFITRRANEELEKGQ